MIVPLFGLPEGDSLADLKEVVNHILQHISGRAVNFNDAYRIGRRNSTDVSGPISSPPPPLLIKLSSVWDKCLIMASSRSLISS